MQAASRGAAIAQGTSIAILPGLSRTQANPYVDVAVPTGLGQMRNALIARACDAMICIGGSWAALSEVALAVILQGWDLPTGPELADTPAHAVELAVARASGMGR